jgi:hypothetical protein
MIGGIQIKIEECFFLMLGHRHYSLRQWSEAEE